MLLAPDLRFLSVYVRARSNQLDNCFGVTKPRRDHDCRIAKTVINLAQSQHIINSIKRSTAT
jgi:hypothetical protein